MRSWCRETREYLADYVMEHGWTDPMGVVPPLWCGQPVQPLSASPGERPLDDTA